MPDGSRVRYMQNPSTCLCVSAPSRLCVDSYPANIDSTPYEGDDCDPEPVTGSNGVAVRRLLQRQLFGKGDDSPGISTVMMDAFNIVQDRIARSRLAGDPPDVMISPKLHGLGLFDFHRAEELIKRGETAARREVEDIQREIEIRRSVERRTAPRDVVAS